MTDKQPPAPTGECFMNSVKFMEKIMVDGYDNEDFKIVHGRVVGQGEAEGWSFGHSWIELNGLVLDVTKSSTDPVVAMASDYYEEGRITDICKYTWNEAQEVMVGVGHFGPWHDELVTRVMGETA